MKSKNKSRGLFEKFAEGDLELAPAFWFFGVFASTVVGIICGLLSEAVSEFFSVVYVVISLLIVIGLFKCAENYKQIMSKKKQSAAWGVLTQIFCAISWIGIMGFIFELF
jgi:hypothetical protein|tara:strand:+ start:90 stop:419 length:330 start_codon:yes stop_codon:yes gene_type:complete